MITEYALEIPVRVSPQLSVSSLFLFCSNDPYGITLLCLQILQNLTHSGNNLNVGRTVLNKMLNGNENSSFFFNVLPFLLPK